MKVTLKILLFIFTISNLFAQTKVEGYLFETNNRGYIKNVKVNISAADFHQELTTNPEGGFSISIPSQIDEFYIITSHKLYQDIDTLIQIAPQKDIQYLKIALERKPAYDFDVILNAKSTYGRYQLEGITGAKVEIYNNTTDQEVLVIDSLENPNFKFALEQGNHYTLLIRKKGYFDKRLEANVNVDGCILCFDGLNLDHRNAMDVLTKGNKMGTILANIQLIPNIKTTTLELKNIHYDYNKWDIRPDAAKALDKAIAIIQKNNVSFVELESHTDSRGSDQYNLNLSQKRADAAVKYIVDHQGIEKGKIFAKGYGETQIVNHCKNGVKCSDEEHEQNRRTKIKIHIFDETPISERSLKQIIKEERLIQSTEGTEIYIKPEKK